jgi:hypothetical protein
VPLRNEIRCVPAMHAAAPQAPEIVESLHLQNLQSRRPHRSRLLLLGETRRAVGAATSTVAQGPSVVCDGGYVIAPLGSTTAKRGSSCTT